MALGAIPGRKFCNAWTKGDPPQKHDRSLRREICQTIPFGSLYSPEEFQILRMSWRNLILFGSEELYSWESGCFVAHHFQG